MQVGRRVGNYTYLRHRIADEPPVPPPRMLTVGLRVAWWYPLPNDGRGTPVVAAVVGPLPMVPLTGYRFY